MNVSYSSQFINISTASVTEKRIPGLDWGEDCTQLSEMLGESKPGRENVSQRIAQATTGVRTRVYGYSDAPHCNKQTHHKLSLCDLLQRQGDIFNSGMKSLVFLFIYLFFIRFLVGEYSELSAYLSGGKKKENPATWG